jgi:hypothetical protein
MTILFLLSIIFKEKKQNKAIATFYNIKNQFNFLSMICL